MTLWGTSRGGGWYCRIWGGTGIAEALIDTDCAGEVGSEGRSLRWIASAGWGAMRSASGLRLALDEISPAIRYKERRL
jgi:hypothetical protein